MTEYEIIKIADAICDRLTKDERFLRHLGKMIPKRDRLLTSRQAADLLGVSAFTIRRIASDLGGVLDSKGRWRFHEAGLLDRYTQMNKCRGN